MAAQMKFGVTLYSFTREFLNYKMSLEDCIAAVAGLGLDGVELVASAHVRGWPWPTDETIKFIRNMCDKHKVRIASYSGQGDRGLRSDRLDLTEDELFHYAYTDLKFAWKMGALAQRQQLNVTPRVIERLAPWAERYKVKVGIEIHQPMTPSSPETMEFFRLFEKIKSPYIGFTPDFGAFAEGPNRMATDLFRKNTRAALADYVLDAGQKSLSIDAVMTGAARLKASQAELTAIKAQYPGLIHKPADIEGFKKLMPYCVHFHAKFHAIDEQGRDQAIPDHKLLPIIRDSRYDGYVALEYEGHWQVTTAATPILRSHLAYMRKVVGMGGT